MKKLLMVLAVLAVSTAAQANPFLVCDPVPAGTVTEYLVFLNGTAYTSPAVPVGTTQTGMMFDLAGKWKTGSNTVTCKARNMWGESAQSVPFLFDANAPAVPGGVKLSAQ